MSETEESTQIQQIEIFCCYAHEDLLLLNKLKAHLFPLQRQGLITLWSDAEISPGTNWQAEIRKHLNSAQVILLLVSPAFIQSDYCYSIEMQRAIERHVCNEAAVIPIILRPILWQGTSLSILQALPPGATPITLWGNIDEALYKTAEGIQNVILTRPTSRPIISSSNSGSFQQPTGWNSQNPLWRSAQSPQGASAYNTVQGLSHQSSFSPLQTASSPSTGVPHQQKHFSWRGCLIGTLIAFFTLTVPFVALPLILHIYTIYLPISLLVIIGIISIIVGLIAGRIVKKF